MPDIEKVIRAWEIFRDDNPYEICSGREFRAIREPEYCMGQMIEDTIALLKGAVSQGTVDQIRWERDTALSQLEEIGKGLGSKMDDIIELLKEQEDIVRCKDCKYWVGGGIDEKDNFIPPKCTWFNKPSSHDWFCAQGRRKD